MTTDNHSESILHSPAHRHRFHDLFGQHPRRPIVTQTLIAINLLVFASMLLYGAGLWHSSNAVQLAWGANFGPATKDGQWWRLGSAMFLHFGVWHLAMNMMALWDSGRLVERLFGRARFLALYIGAGLSGNLMSLLIQGDQAVSGGASGAIFGVYGALLVTLWRHRSLINPHEFKWLFGGAVLFSIATLALGFIITGIDNSAHVGGFASGMLLGIALEHPDIARRRSQRLLAGLVLLLAIVVMAVSLPAPKYRWHQEQNARKEISKVIGADARISQQWGVLLKQSELQGGSFDELAGRIEDQVAEPYEQTFDQLSKLELSPAAPSAVTLTNVRRYLEMRRDASQGLVEGLRAKDPQQIRESLEQAREARQIMDNSLQTSKNPPAKSPGDRPAKQ